MKRILLSLMTLLFALSAKSQTVPDGYHQGDYTWLYNYINANSTAFGIGTTYTDFDDFFDEEAYVNGVNWYSEPDTPKRITSLVWSPNDEATLQSKLTGTLDVSALDKLVTLICKHNEITGLKLPVDIETLYCWDNQLREIETESLTKLQQLNCANNQITALDVTHLASTLIGLSCYNNQLEALDVKDLTELEALGCYKNKLKKLEITNLVKLTVLSCWGNELTTLDTAPLVDLEFLYCSDNKLTELVVTSEKLVGFECNRNHIPFSKLPLVFASSFNYHNPQTVTHPQSVYQGQVVDLSSMVVPGGTTTVSYGGNELDPLDEDNTTFTIPTDWPLGEVTLEMKNSKFEQSGNTNPSKYIFTVTTPSVYHTINLEVADGIDLYNMTAGNHSVEEGSHLHLQFLPEDRTLTADDILFLIDGVETSFTELGENNYFSYILNPVEQDHTILIALKEYPVTLTETEGVTYDVGAGTHLVGYGEKFTFSLTLADGIDPEKVHVYANGREIEPDALRSVVLTYTIDKVITPITVVIEGAGDPVTSNAGLSTDGIRLEIVNCQLSIVNSTSTAVDVAVYAVTGQSVVSLRGLRGSKTISLQPGIYIVKAGSEVFKVSVN